VAERGWFAAGGAALAAVLFGLPAASTAGQDSIIVVHLEDQTRILPDDLEIIRKHVNDIFHAAGVAVSWAGPLQRPVSDLSCDGVRRVAVSIINIQQPFSNDARDTDDVLGRAAPAYARAWVFRNRVAQIGKNRPVDVNLLLARAIAHEIGHLLLPAATSHGAVGIMRPGLELNHVGIVRFTREESKLIRTAPAGSRRPASSGLTGHCK
jgi:hypothetical protein